MVLGRCLLLFAVACRAELTVFNDDGAWNWFQDERAVIHGKYLYAGSVAYNLATGGRSRAVVHPHHHELPRR